MPPHKVIIVHLRKPHKRTDRRDDPFWEFGSFGITGCHADNQLHPKNAHDLIGVRLAFAQGGKLGTRLVFLTPPINRVVVYRDRSEVLWSPSEMPFQYGSAPLLINKDGESDFPFLKRTLRGGDRSTWVGQFGSNFRSSKQLLSSKVARELVMVCERNPRAAGRAAIAENYVEALPVQREPVPRSVRLEVYEQKREEAGRVQSVQGYPSRFKKKRRRGC